MTEILDYEPRHRSDFERLNVEWLEQFFVVEPIDRKILSDPEAHILAEGGYILMAEDGGDVVGTVALKRQGPASVELTKMAVTPGSQGKGIGRQLLDAAIQRFRRIDADCLYLESHSSLDAAIGLYERAGFRHQAPPAPSDYARADVYMVYYPPNGD
ncbi:MAG: GNAT family N-acetyltransferase [Pseudomonadota bacterium]